MSSVMMSNKFPGKLWQIVNECKTGAISWGQGGQTIVVHQTKFQEDYLDPPNGLFKTTNIGSFIRQLNLYGFRKLNTLRFANSGAELREIHEFQNDFFVRDQPHLLSRLRRNVGIRRSREAAVEKRLDEIHGYSAKRQHLLELQGTRYLDLPHQVQALPGVMKQRHAHGHGHSHDGPDAGPNYQIAATNGQLPVYMQWEGHAYQYSLRPDPIQQTVVQPVVHIRKEINGEAFQVIHLPENGQGEPAGDYFLLGLVPEQMPTLPQLQPQEYQHVPDPAPRSYSPPSGSPEYSTQELYQLAELLASNPQCAIAAAQQLLCQSSQDLSTEGILPDKIDGINSPSPAIVGSLHSQPSSLDSAVPSTLLFHER